MKDKTGKLQYDFSGKLSFSWPKTPTQNANWGDQQYEPLFPYGFGLTYKDKNFLANNLPENLSIQDSNQTSLNADTEGRDVTTPEHVILKGTVKSPWSAAIFSEDKQREIIANVQKLEGIKYRTIDKAVQEDAIRLIFERSTRAGFKIFSQGNIEQSLQLDNSEKVLLRFSVRLEKAIEGKIALSMDCRSSSEITGSSCGKKVSIDQQLAPLTLDDWHSFSVELACFKNSNFNLTRIISPFTISADAPNQIGLADIVITRDTGHKANISCT